jgi:ABC-type antimicrobial peptide transport system permease subunit
LRLHPESERGSGQHDRCPDPRSLFVWHTGADGYKGYLFSNKTRGREAPVQDDLPSKSPRRWLLRLDLRVRDLPTRYLARNYFDHVRDLEGWIQREPEYARARLISMLFGAFSILALSLAAVGLYSVVSYTVLQRTSELGVRVALGARRRDVMSIVAVSAGTGVGLGIAAGLALSFGLSRIIGRWIENGAHDPIMVLAVSMLLIAVAALACLVPARRALSIDSMVALRCE